MLAFEHLEGLNLQRSFPIPAEQNSANLQPSAWNSKECVHYSQTDLLQRFGGILDCKGTGIQSGNPVSIVWKRLALAHSPRDSVVIGPQSYRRLREHVL